MDASDDLEENSVAGHGVAHARSAKHGRIHGAQGGDDHCKSDPAGGSRAFNVRNHIGGDVLRCGYGFKRQHIQASPGKKQVNHGDESDSTDQRAREILLRVFHFGADEI